MRGREIASVREVGGWKIVMLISVMVISVRGATLYELLMLEVCTLYILHKTI